jgi:hypothetical protein
LVGSSGREIAADMAWIGKGDWNPLAGFSHCLCRLW